jgi:hypothetical protein
VLELIECEGSTAEHLPCPCCAVLLPPLQGSIEERTMELAATAADRLQRERAVSCQHAQAARSVNCQHAAQAGCVTSLLGS